MTIKPVSAPSSKRVSGNVVDADNKESHSNGQVVVVNEQSVVNQTHRNVVIDGHGQSPQRRGEVYDELARTHRCSPHKSTRSKRRDHHEGHSHHHKRDRLEREKLAHTTGVGSIGNVVVGVNGVNSPHAVNSSSSVASVSSSGSGGGSVGVGRLSPDPQTQEAAAANLLKAVEETFSGYNSGDEHLQPKERQTSEEEWQRRDEEFAKCMAQRGYELKAVEEDGACLFRSISLQIYGDEGMHDDIRQHTMDYVHKNREYFGQFVTEDINGYIKRKRARDAHGNHIEIQAISEIYGRTVEVYCYQSTPINIFNSEQSQAGCPPLRLSYQRGSHYNAILDPYNATVGVGLGLAGYKPQIQTKEAARLSEQLEIEQTMFEDKLKTTDWEATNEAIEEQIARESYLQWCRDNIQRSRTSTATTTVAAGSATSSTVTSAEALTDSDASPSKCGSGLGGNGGASSSTIHGNNENNTNSTNNNSNNNNNLTPKTLLQFAHKQLSPDNINDYDSDATDMSSTSSSTNTSPPSSGSGSGGGQPRKSKSSKPQRRSNGLRTNKKRRHEREINSNATNQQTTKSLPNELDVPLRKSPKRALTPEIAEKPCTSKQSNTPEKTPKSSSANNGQKNYSSFYQELLETSYATEGFNENEMLQRAIQMSTNDYIEDQKRKYFYGP